MRHKENIVNALQVNLMSDHKWSSNDELQELRYKKARHALCRPKLKHKAPTFSHLLCRSGAFVI
jgi:hypothetical protein